MNEDRLILERDEKYAWTVTMIRDGKTLKHVLGLCPPEDALAAALHYQYHGIPDLVAPADKPQA